MGNNENHRIIIGENGKEKIFETTGCCDFDLAKEGENFSDFENVGRRRKIVWAKKKVKEVENLVGGF